MRTYRTGLRVGKGTYWSVTSGRRIDVFDQAVLSGRVPETYIKAPPAVALAAGPFLGLMYSVTLPFLGIGTVIFLAVRSVAAGFCHAAVKSASFGWRPAKTCLARKKKKDYSDGPRVSAEK